MIKSVPVMSRLSSVKNVSINVGLSKNSNQLAVCELTDDVNSLTISYLLVSGDPENETVFVSILSTQEGRLHKGRTNCRLRLDYCEESITTVAMTILLNMAFM